MRLDPDLQSDLRFQHEGEAYRYVEACIWPHGAVCPKCGELKRVGPLKGESTRIGTYKCYRCRKPFSVKVGTALEGSHVLMHVWLKAILLTTLSRRAIPPKELAQILEVSPRTAEFLSIRVQAALQRAASCDDLVLSVQESETSPCNPTMQEPADRRPPRESRPRQIVACENS